MRYLYILALSVLPMVILTACSYPEVSQKQSGDMTTSCYEVEDEMKEMEAALEETDFRDDIVYRAQELERLHNLKNCH